jgi:hypothetical protein
METDAPATIPDLADPLEPYRRWATVLFWILIVVSIVAGGAALIAFSVTATMAVVLLLAVGLGLGSLLVETLALGRREAWAVHAIRPICFVIIAAGVLRVAVALSQSNITIPLEVIGALMVLSREHRPQFLPPIPDADRQKLNLVVGAQVVSQVLPYLAGPVFV